MSIVKISLGGVYIMDLKKIDFKEPTTICVLVGSVLMLLASFLPMSQAKISMLGMSESTTGNLMKDYGHQGIFILILAVAAVVVLFLGLNREKILSAVLGALAAFGAWGVFGVFKDVSDAKSEIKKSGAGEYMKASYQFGFFVLIIGIAAVIGAIVLISMNSKKNAPAAQQ